MNTITIEKAGTVETLTIPDDAIDAVTAELTERFGKRGGFVDDQKCWWLGGTGHIYESTFDGNSDTDHSLVLMGNIFHTETEAIAAKERRLAEQRLRKAYLAVTGGAELPKEFRA